MALRLMKSLPTMVMLLVALVAMLVTEPHLAEATPGFLDRGVNKPGRSSGGKSEEHRNTSPNSPGNHGVHNGGVSNGSGSGSSKHVGGNMHAGRINKGGIGHKRSTTYAHPGEKPGVRNTTDNKGGKGGHTINIGRKRNRTRHIPVGGNIHIRKNGTNVGHRGHFIGPFITPGIVHNHPVKEPEKGNQSHSGVHNHVGNRNGNGGHTFVGRNGGGNSRINHGGLNKTRGNGAHQNPIGGNGSGSSSDQSGGKTPGASNETRGSGAHQNPIGGNGSGSSSDQSGGETPGVSNGGDKGDNKVGNPGDNNEANHSGDISGHVGEGGNVPAGNTTGPDCKKKGGICGDPKVVGGDGVVFYFYGRKDHDFCLISDSNLHINAHFIGTHPPGHTRDNTWVQALGFVFGSHTLTIAAKRNISQWRSQEDHLDFSYNGEPLHLNTMSWASPDSAMTLTRIGAANSVDMAIKGKMEVSLTVVPISKKANLVHKYDIPEDIDCFAHFDMQFKFYNLSSTVNGVLGQTYRPGFINPVNQSVAVPIMGEAEKFESSSLLATDCKMSQYTASVIRAGSATTNFHTVCHSGGLPSGVAGGITCHR